MRALAQAHSRRGLLVNAGGKPRLRSVSRSQPCSSAAAAIRTLTDLITSLEEARAGGNTISFGLVAGHASP
jgi:hypothetical protein